MKEKDKKALNVRELANKYQVNCDRISEIAETCEREQRERSDAEEAEYIAIVRENMFLQMKMQAASVPGQIFEQRSIGVQLREALTEAMEGGSRNPVTLLLTREADSAIQTTAALEGTGIIAVNEQEMLKPLRAGLIYNKVGITIRTGLVGNLRWPKHGKATAKFVGEAEKLTTQKIDWDKITVSPKRLGCAIPVTRQELFQSEGVVESVITSEMPQAVVDKVNDALFTTDKTGRVVYGPFATAGEEGGCQKVTFAADVPTRKELLQMKAQIAKAGIDPSTCCFVMTETMKAELEDVPVDKGSGRFLCENDRILGYPVFCTDSIGEGKIGFGDWGYQAAGFFGQLSFIVDPYSLSLEDSTRFVLNTDFATITLRPEAFILGEVTA